MFRDVSLFDWLDLSIVTALFAASFWFGGSKTRWHLTVAILAVHLVAARAFLHFLDEPIAAMALTDAILAMVLLFYSETNYGRFVGLCFFGMVALEGLAIAGIIEWKIKYGLHLNFWNGISILQHVQAMTLFTCFWRNRASSWAAV